MQDATGHSARADGRAIETDDAHGVAITEMSETTASSTPQFDVRFDAAASLFVAHRGDEEVGYVSIERSGPHRVVLRALGVVPPHRGEGIVSSLARRVLDQLQEDGEGVAVVCPAVRAFIARNPEYAQRSSVEIQM